MAINWEDFTPVADAPEAVNWDAFQPVAEPDALETNARAQRQADLRAQLAVEWAKPTPGLVQGFVANETQALANVAKGAAQVVPSTLRAIGTGGAFISRQTGIPGPTVPEETGTFKVGEAIQRQLDRLPTGAGQGEDFLLQDVPQAIGQMGSMLATGGTAKALGAGAKVAGVIASTSGFGQEFDDAMQTATARGDDADTAFAKSLGYASVATLIENLGGAGRVFRKYFPEPEAAAKVLTKLGISKAIAANFIAGYAEEAGQRIAQNVIVGDAGTFADLLEGANREGMAGSLVQGVVSLPAAGIGRVPTRATDYAGTPVPPTSRQADPVPPQRATAATAGQPLAVFRGANGQEIFVTLGDATVEQVQEMMFRTQPGATFIRTEGGATSDTANITPTKNVPADAVSPAAPPEQSSEIDYSPMDYAGGEVNWEDFTPVEEAVIAPVAEELPAPPTAEPKAAAEPAPAAAAPAPSGITEGQTVFARLSLKSNKLHKATVVRVTEDGITVRYAKSKKFQTLPHGQVQLPANVAGRKLYESQFDDLDPEAKKAAKTSARAFDDAIRNEGWRFQWYDPQHETNTETAGQRAASQAAFKRGRAAAFQALGLTTDPESALDRAAALPALQAFLKERRGDVEQQQDFDAATEDGPVPVQADELAVGMVLDIDGEETTVVDVSPEGVVTLQDGTKFGRQTLESGETIYVEAVQGEASTEFLPEEPAAPALTLDAPESIEQQRVREEAEAAQRAEQAAKDKLKERAAKSLVGSTGDLGQGDLLGAPTDLFAPPAPKAKPFGSENTLITSSKAEELRKRLREKLGTQSTMGVDPTIFADAVQLGVYYLEGGIRAFPAWSAKMIEDLGDGIRPWLRSVYEGARSFPGANYEDNMDTHERVRELAKSYVTGANPSVERTGDGAGGAARQPGARDVQPQVAGQGGGRGGSVGAQPGAAPAGSGNPLGGGGDLPVDAVGSGDPVLPEQRPIAGRPVAKPGGRADGGGRSRPDESRTSAESQSDLGTPGSPKVANDAPKLEAGTGASDAERAQLQRQAEGVTWQAANLENIQASLPMLLPPQQEDVLKTERRFFQEQPTPPQGGSAEALGDPKRGILFTNGTGTGKTFTGLGIIKRFLQQGKRNILIVAPTQTVVDGWQREGKLLLIEVNPLKDTTNAGTGVVVTTYANFRQNESLLTRDFDLVVMDECHHILSNEAGEFTAGIQAFRRNANHPEQVRWKAARKVVGPQPQVADFKTKDLHLIALRSYVAAVERNKALIDREVERLNTINTRTVFLSATPFAYHKSLQLVDGFLYSLPSDEGRGGYNTPRGFDRVLVESFGYRMRVGKVTQPEQSVRVDLMEMAFNDALVKKGAISGRIIDVPTDYSREFVIVDSELGRLLDAGFTFLGGHDAYKQFPGLNAVFRAFWDYNQKAQLLEALKMAEAIPRIQEHIKLGRKIILFHTYIQSGTAVHPFRFNTYQDAEFIAGQAGVKPAEFQKQMAEFEAAHPELVNMEMPSTGKSLARIEREFGAAAVFFNGTVSRRKRAEGVIDFNRDNNTVKLIVAQLQAGKEGISLHDRTGAHQRVVMIAALPSRPTDAVQAEGRAYRIGVLTNAIYEYLALHSLMERFQFGSKINEKVSTVESLALGSLARNLRERFKDAYLNATDSAPSEQQGSGGKVSDRRAETASDFEKAKTFYFGRLKKNSRTKSAEGVDYFATPEPLGLKMVEWARPRTGEHALEPSAGHGAIGRFFPETTNRTYVEPSAELRSELGVKVNGGRVIASQFEDLDIVNKYDVIVTNPPFGSGGSTAMQHLAKMAWSHLRDGGRIVALIPEGPAADAKFEKFMEDPRSRHLYVRRVLGLPTSVFERAGTSVKTRIVIIDRSDSAGLESQGRVDFRGDEDINEFFDAIEDVDSIERPVSKQPDVAPATVPSAEQAPSPTPNPTGQPLLKPAQTIHALKKIPMFVATTTRRVSKDDYAYLASNAKHNGGYWSSFAKNGAIPGFQFPTAKQRDAFIEKMSGVLDAPAPASAPATEVNDAAAQMTTPEAVATTLLDDQATPAQQQAAEQKADEAEQRVRGMRLNPKNRGEAGFTNLPQILADLLVAGARVLKRGGQWAMTRAQWSAAMLKQFGQGISRWLSNTWGRLQRVQNQQTAGAVAIGHVNAIEELAGNTNIAEEQKPLYTPAQLAAGRPSLLTKAAPTSTQIKLLGGSALLDAKRRRDVEEATQAAAVRAQSDELWKQLVASAARANPLANWHLPQWLIGTTRARKFKERALHIASRLNATARDANGNFIFTDFRQRMGGMSVKQFAKSKLAVGDQIQMANPATGAMELVTVGPLITTPDGRVFHQLYRDIDAATQAALYQHYAAEYPDMIWFLDMFIDPVLANTRQTINGIEIPVFNRFAAAAMMADGNPNFSPLAAYTPDVLVTRSLIGSIRGALSFRSGTRSPGRKYKSGTSREGGHVRDLLSGFNIRTWQMLAEQSRKGWMRAVLAAATPIQKGQVPAGWVKLETGMEELWLAVKRLRNWSSPNEYKDITKQVQDDGLEEIEATLKEGQSIVQKDGRWFIATKLFPETEARMSQRGQLDEDRDYSAFFGEAASLRGRQLMLPEQLVKQLIGKYVAHVEHGALYRLGAWAVRNSTRLLLVAPTTYVANVLTNDLFTLEAASRRILSGVAGANVQDLRFARELAIGEFYKFFPGLRSLVDGRFRNTVQEILPENIFADQTALADLKMRLDEDPISYLRQGEIGAAALQLIRYGDIDVKAKTRMAYAWLKAQAVTNARKAGLRGGALRVAVDVYLENPPMADRARAVEIAGFELLNYADTPDWLQNLASNDYSKLVLPFPRFGYHYIAKNAQRAAALRDVLAKVPSQKRADAFADFVTFLLWSAGGLGVLAALGLKGLGDDDDEARKLVGTSRLKTLDEAGDVVSKPIDRAIVTSNRINLSAWARQLGLGTDSENDFWLRVRNYPVVAMAGAALLAEDDAREFGPKEGAKTYLNMVGDLAGDFFSLGLAARVPAKAYQELFGRPGDRTAVDAYAAGVPFVAYVTDQTLDSFLPGTRQADLMIRWLDPVARRRTVSKTEDYTPTIWDAARVGHLPGLLDRLMTGGPGEHGAFESTLPAETSRRSPEPQVLSLQQRMAELAGFNIKPINRRDYESAIAK